MLSLTVTASVSITNLERDVQQKCAVGVEHNSGAAVRFEAGVVDFKHVVADREYWEIVAPRSLAVADCRTPVLGLSQSDGSFRNRRARGVFDGAGDAAAYTGEGCAQVDKQYQQHKQIFADSDRLA